MANVHCPPLPPPSKEKTSHIKGQRTEKNAMGPVPGIHTHAAMPHRAHRREHQPAPQAKGKEKERAPTNNKKSYRRHAKGKNEKAKDVSAQPGASTPRPFTAVLGGRGGGEGIARMRYQRAAHAKRGKERHTYAQKYSVRVHKKRKRHTPKNESKHPRCCFFPPLLPHVRRSRDKGSLGGAVDSGDGAKDHRNNPSDEQQVRGHVVQQAHFA